MSDTNELLLDKLGQEIRPGRWIVYGHALGRCAGLRIGVVLAVKRGEIPISVYNIPMPWNREDRITVWGLDDDHIEFSRCNPNDEWAKTKPLTKKSTLLFSSRIIVLDEKLVPDTYRDIMQPIIERELAQ